MSASPETVVLVHGLWLNGVESLFLRRRLQGLGFDVCQFSYRTVSESLEDNARSLHAFVAGLSKPIVHLVGHSLGGLVILRLDERHDDLPQGRRVLLGSPVAGSKAADGLAHHAWGRRILGRCLAEAVLERPDWHAGSHETGIIAGSLGVGLGRLFATFDGPHDGTVSVAETQLADATAHRVLPLTHMSLLFSREVTAEVAHFLEFGRFS
ncbi:MAG: esterase/lipase family protein [Gammaproteobacteria bacterium]